jgi:hypothetical protein
MKYLKLYENFRNQTPLERQFSEIMVPNLISDDKEIKEFWATLNALKIEIKDFIDTEDTIYKEMLYRIVDNQDPVRVMEDIVYKVGESPEMKRLLTKLNDINPYKYKEDTYSDSDEEMTN